ncbi:MAG: cation:proton antiporter [Desulfurococcales archaeon]|nr:cation:proton antiporter [Desulfurococcales archaeon]
MLTDVLWKALLISLALVFIARPVAVLPLRSVGHWSWREVLFIGLEGPRGVVPSALATLPLSLGLSTDRKQ